MAQLNDALSLHTNLTWMDSEIVIGRDAIDRAAAENASVGLILAGAPTAAINAAREATAINLTGHQLAKIPQLVANVRLTHQLDLTSGAMIRSSAIYNYRGDYFARVFNSPERDLVPSYQLVNANFAYYPAKGNWSAELNIQNLFNDASVASIHTDTFGIGVTSQQYLAPRVITLMARYNF